MPPTNSLLVAQITDTHLFADGDGKLAKFCTADSLQAVLKKLEDLNPKPDLLLLTGDLSQDETDVSYIRLRDLVTPLTIPAYWIPGNHDAPELMQSVLQNPYISTQKSFQAGGWNFVLLSSTVPGETYGELSLSSLEWLESQLQAFSDQPTLIALHHPPFPIGSEWMDEISLQNPEALFEIIGRYSQVKLVLFGHIHQEFDYQHLGVGYLGSPSTCVQFKPKSRDFAVDEQKPGFRLLELNLDGSYSTKIVRVDYAPQGEVAIAS